MQIWKKKDFIFCSHNMNGKQLIKKKYHWTSLSIMKDPVYE